MLRSGAAVLRIVGVGPALGLAEPFGLPEPPGWGVSVGSSDGPTDSAGLGVTVIVGTGVGVGVA